MIALGILIGMLLMLALFAVAWALNGPPWEPATYRRIPPGVDGANHDGGAA